MLKASESEMLTRKEEILSLREKVSKCDKKRSAILHRIETEIFNEEESVALVKELKELSQERRAWKESIYIAQKNYDRLGGERHLKVLQKRRKNKIKQVTRSHSWYDNFTPESLSIMKNAVVN